VQKVEGPTTFTVFALEKPTGGSGSLVMYGRAVKSEGGTAWETFSDRRLKHDVREYETGLNAILQLRPVRFRYNDDPECGLSSAREEVGFIAQEAREVIPDAVTEGKDGYLSLKADPIHWAAINAIKELNAKLEDKDKRIAILEQQMNEVKALLRELATKKDTSREQTNSQ
jgi:trimeric autotransporter adhesin